MKNPTILLTIASLFYSLMLIIFVSLKGIKKNSMIKSLMYVNFIGIIIEIFYYFIPFNNHVLKFIMSRCFLIYLLIWLFTLIIYIYKISYIQNGMSVPSLRKNREKLLLKVSIILLVLVCIAVIFLPLYDNVKRIYSYGPSANLVYYTSEIMIMIGLIIMFKNRNKSKGRYTPFFVYIIGGTVVMILQSSHPEYLLMTFMETIVTYVLFFTEDFFLTKNIDSKNKEEK